MQRSTGLNPGDCLDSPLQVVLVTMKDRAPHGCYPFAQSICTHYSSLSGQPDIFLGFGTLKKRRPGCLFSFWITMILFFCTLLFATHFLDLFFQGHKPTNVFKTRIVGADWLGEYVGQNNFQKTSYHSLDKIFFVFD